MHNVYPSCTGVSGNLISFVTTNIWVKKHDLVHIIFDSSYFKVENDTQFSVQLCSFGTDGILLSYYRINDPLLSFSFSLKIWDWR